MKEPINMSEWTLDRIQAEQDKHMSFKVTGVIPTVNRQQIEHNLDPIGTALDAYIHKVNEDTDMYIICEIAKIYVESLRPAEWELSDITGTYICSNCHTESFHLLLDEPAPKYCSNCGRRMKHGTDL